MARRNSGVTIAEGRLWLAHGSRGDMDGGAMNIQSAALNGATLDSFKETPSDLPGRKAASSATYDGRIFLFGGLQPGDDICLSSVAVSPPLANTSDEVKWSLFEVFDEQHPPCASSATVVGTTAYVTGGVVRQNRVKSLHAYRVALDELAALPPGSDASRTVTRYDSFADGWSHHGSAVVRDNLFLVGGCTNSSGQCLPSRHVARAGIDSNGDLEPLVDETPLLIDTSHASAIGVGDFIIVVGGKTSTEVEDKIDGDLRVWWNVIRSDHSLGQWLEGPSMPDAPPPLLKTRSARLLVVDDLLYSVSSRIDVAPLLARDGS